MTMAARSVGVPLILMVAFSLATGCETPESAQSAPDDSEPSSSVKTNELWVPKEGDFVLRDNQTNSLWNLRGEAFQGPLEGKKLQQLPAFNSFWFAWSAFYDGSEIWQADGPRIVNAPGDIGKGDGCLVPCDEIKMGCPGKDCIPALDYDARPYAGRERPKAAEMVPVGAPETDYLDAKDLVLGVVIDGQARAYPLKLYWHHEIHNDRVDGQEYSVSFCPLTGSGIVFDGRHDGEPIRFGVSGRLFQSNLVMFDPSTETFWSQMMGRGIKGAKMGDSLERLPVVETTWERWQRMYPETLVTSSQTGYQRDYQRYPYGDYRNNHQNTFGTEAFESTYDAKDRVLGLPASGDKRSLAFPFPELESLQGGRNVVHAEFGGDPIIVVYESEHRLAIPFRATVDSRELSFSVERAP